MVSTLPDVHTAIPPLMANQTSAADRVSTQLPRDPTFPYLTYRRDGGPRTPEDNRLDTARIVFETWGGTGGHQEAYTLALEVSGVLMPLTNIVDGYVGTVNGVRIAGVRPDSGPSLITDEYYGPKYRVSFLVTYT